MVYAAAQPHLLSQKLEADRKDNKHATEKQQTIDENWHSFRLHRITATTKREKQDGTSPTSCPFCWLQRTTGFWQRLPRDNATCPVPQFLGFTPTLPRRPELPVASYLALTTTIHIVHSFLCSRRRDRPVRRRIATATPHGRLAVFCLGHGLWQCRR